MKKIYLLLTVLFFSVASFAQDAVSYHYQVIILPADYDKGSQKHFVRLNADPGPQEFPEFKKLVWWSQKKSAENAPSTFYTGQTDTASTYYNFFPNTTMAISYLASYNWEMINVISVTQGDKDGIQTTPMYYFRKKK